LNDAAFRGSRRGRLLPGTPAQPPGPRIRGPLVDRQKPATMRAPELRMRPWLRPGCSFSPSGIRSSLKAPMSDASKSFWAAVAIVHAYRTRLGNFQRVPLGHRRTFMKTVLSPLTSGDGRRRALQGTAREAG